MNSTFSHKIGLIFVAIATSAIAGCGSSAMNVRPVEARTVATSEVTAADSDMPDPSQPTSFYKVSVTPRQARAAHPFVASSCSFRTRCADGKCDLARLDDQPVIGMR